MKIVNDADIACSWFCYNQSDPSKFIALASGDLDKGKSTQYTPPPNQNNLYFVRFTQKGGGVELAGASLTSSETITLEGKNGRYHAKVT